MSMEQPTVYRPGRGELADFLNQPVLQVAPQLLGAHLVHAGVSVRITEVEAYDGANDPGSHAYRGRTARTATMFGPPGHLYVYLIYGMHHCCNIVTGSQGSAAAVLVRAGEVVQGVAQAQTRRGKSSRRDLARGPGRLCQALGITRELDGAELSSGPVELLLPVAPVAEYSTGPRVGVRRAAEWPWRYWITSDPTVSRYVAAKPLPEGR